MIFEQRYERQNIKFKRRTRKRNFAGGWRREATIGCEPRRKSENFAPSHGDERRMGEKMRKQLADAGEAGGSLDLELLQRLGTRLDSRPKRLDGKTIRQFLVEKLLRVRTKQGEIKPLVLNQAQQEYEGRCNQKNIVLKARQLGITTYVAARFFVHTITKRGTLSVQVAHDQDSAEEIFRS